MKETYTKPQSIINEFETVDVITTSTQNIEVVGGDDFE